RLILAAHGSVKWILLALMTIAAMFSMWVENTATAAMLIPVALMLTANVVDKRLSERLRVLFVLGVAYGSSLGGMITVIGSASNAVAFSFIQEVQQMTFLDWIRMGLPAFCVIFPVTWWVLLKLFPVSSSKLNLDLVDREYRKLGSLHPPERDTIGTLCAAIFFWMFGSWFENILGLPPTVLSPTVIAIAAVSFLTIRQVINWEDVKGVSWGFLFIIGAGLSLGETLVRTGLTTWLIQLFGPLLSVPSSWLTITLFSYISAFLTNLINNATVVAIFIPIVLNLSNSISLTLGLPLAFAIALATTFGYSLPSASGRMAIISASNLISDREMLKCGLLVTLISTLLLAGFIYVAGIVHWI
ncbi:MAG: anion permease, partial [Candidatus Bathyarchaeota archaeon]